MACKISANFTSHYLCDYVKTMLKIIVLPFSQLNTLEKTVLMNE